MIKGFKPYYNWNTFNTAEFKKYEHLLDVVLNLIITGIPSIQTKRRWKKKG